MDSWPWLQKEQMTTEVGGTLQAPPPPLTGNSRHSPLTWWPVSTSHSWHQGICHFTWQRDSAEEIKTLEMGSYPGLSGWSNVTTKGLTKHNVRKRHDDEIRLKQHALRAEGATSQERRCSQSRKRQGALSLQPRKGAALSTPSF